MDNLVFEESINTEITHSEFVEKQFLYVNDNNNASYTGQVVIDTTSLSNCGSYINWSEAFLAIPLVLQSEFSAFTNSDTVPLDYTMGLKNGFWQIIHSMSVEFNNGSIIQQTPFLNVFSSFKNLTSWSLNDLKNWGDVCGFYPDSADSWLYNNINVPASLVNFLNTSGQGFCNNRNSPATSSVNFGTWSGSFVVGNGVAAVTAITTYSGNLCVGMMVSGTGIAAGTYVSAIVYVSGVPSTATLSINTTAAVANTAPIFGVSPTLNLSSYPTSQATLQSDNFRATYNYGLSQRQSWLNYSAAVATDGLATSITNNQTSILTNGANGFNSIFMSYVQKSTTSRAIVFDAVVRLKDIADFFHKVPLLKGSTMRLYINTNQAYFTCGYVPSTIAGTVSVTGGSAGISLSQTQTGCLALTSSPIILGGGNTNPIMVASVDLGQGGYNFVPAGLTTPSAPVSVKYGLSIVKTQFTSGQFTSQFTAPVTSVRLYAPAYTMSPIAEQRYLSLNPTKKIVYNDIFYYTYQSIPASSTFSVLVSNGLPNIRSVVVIPMLPKASNGYASTYPSSTALAGVTTSTLLSPFSTTGGTPDPISFTNFQIQISGKNLFINNLLYDYETFQEQLVSSHQLNGSLTTSLSSGLIGKDDFETLYRYYYGNASRSISAEDGIAKAVQVMGTNQSPNVIDIMVFIEFERSITIDCRTGARVA